MDLIKSILWGFLLENADDLKRQVIEWAWESAKRSDTPWDDEFVKLLALFLGVDVPA